MNENINLFFSTNKDKNIAFHITNDKNQVINARKNLCKKYNLNYQNLKYMNQMHSNIVQITNEDTNVYKCDALITNQKNTPLMVMVADCIPILFHDDVQGVIAVAHAGRNGTYLNIVSNVISKINEEFSSNIQNIKVILGPSIQKCCYEVSTELEQIAIKNFGKDIANNRYIDLQQINKNQLLAIGIVEKNISISTICTKCNGKDYFSYRQNKNCGRFAGFIELL